MKLKFWVLTAIFWVSQPIFAFTAEQKAQQAIDPVLARYRTFFAQEVKRRHIPGTAVAIVYQGQVVWMEGFGVRNLKTREPVNLDTVFQLGSVSKPFAGTLAALLAQEGVLHFDDPVAQYLPGFHLERAPNASDLRLRHILSHSSGIPRAGFNHMIESYVPYKDIKSKMQSTKALCAPGRCFDYHNAMFSLIKDVVQQTTAQSFEQALKTRLLQPLHMDHTSASLEGLLNTYNYAQPHVRTKNGMAALGSHSQGYYAVAPAGGVNSSIRDMAKFLQLQLGGYPGLLQPKYLAQLHSPYVVAHDGNQRYRHFRDRIHGSYYGMGFRIMHFANHKVVYHGGMLKGFMNFMAVMPDKKVGIVILQNADTGFSWQTALRFFDMFLRLPEKNWSGAPSPVNSTVVKRQYNKKLNVVAAKKKRPPSKSKIQAKRAPTPVPVANKNKIALRGPALPTSTR